MNTARRDPAFTPEYLDLAGDHLRTADTRVRWFDLEIESLMREADAARSAPSVPSSKRITELVLLLLQFRDMSERINGFLVGAIAHHHPTMSEADLEGIRGGLEVLPDLLSSHHDDESFVRFVKRYLETIDYPGYSRVELGITELRDMSAYRVAYTPGVAKMCLLVQALQTHIALLSNIGFMDLRGSTRKVIHVIQDRLIEAVRSLTGSTGSIHIPRLSQGTRWRNPHTRSWETHPVLLAARTYIDSLPGPICLIVTDQTAVLGLEDIGPRAGHPVMVGKAKINASAGRFTALPVAIDSTDDDSIVAIVELLASSPQVGSVNIEDITGRGGRCFRIQRELQRRVAVPIFHDDQDGTAIITLAGLLTALEHQGKELADCRIVISGAGAAGIQVARYLLAAGATGSNLVVMELHGLLSTARPDLVDDPERNPHFAYNAEMIDLLRSIRGDQHGAYARAALAGEPPPTDRAAATHEDRTLAMEGADVFIGLSAANIITEAHLRSMAPRPVVFACANPEPEIPYAVALASRDDIIVGSGSSLYPNQINNAVAFPGLLAGLMLAEARTLDVQVGVAAARAIAARTAELHAADPSYDEVVPRVVDRPLHEQVARATLDHVFARGLNAADGAPAPDRAACEAELRRRFAR